MICIYVGIGQKQSTIAGIHAKLEEMGAMDYSIIVASTASEPAPLLYLAPYAGVAMAEEFMEAESKDVLIIYDDLSKHAVAYREMSCCSVVLPDVKLIRATFLPPFPPVGESL